MIDNVAWISQGSNFVHKKKEIGGACSKLLEKEVYRIWWANVKERDYLENLGIDGKILFKWFLKKWDEGHGLNLCA